MECKKYSDTTRLNDRELLGEIDHALDRDEALEAWILVVTREVPEQLEQDLFKKSEETGVPVVIIDWKNHGVAALAALCAFAPDVVETYFSKAAAGYARALQPAAGSAIDRLRRDLQAWCLGFETLRCRSHDRLDKIWHSPRTSNAEFGQNAAGGAEDKKVRRAAVHAALDSWWQEEAQTDAPAAVIGLNGVGKTWAALHWLFEHQDAQPIVLIVPSSALAGLTGSETKVKHFLADRLYALSGEVRSPAHWLRRLERLLKRPPAEGPVLTLFIDGLNQNASVPWLALLKVLQGETFAGRLRVVISTRNHHFEDKLAKLRGLSVPAVPVPVDIYDTKPDGELEQMLAFEHLTQAHLPHPDLLELARTPRLFKLVVKLRDRLVDAGKVTVHRLLWEYGRDTLGERAGTSFSESEWKDWLGKIARQYREGVREHSVNSLGDTVNRPDLSPSEVYIRLSDIIDGRFAETDTSGSLRLVPTVVAHALGAALLNHLHAVTPRDFATLEAKLTDWLDPITGLDERAEVLRAAVSIWLEQDKAQDNAIAGVLVTAWLQTQNISDAHRQELAHLAANLTTALLDAVEHSTSRAHASARLWAINALRAIPRSDGTALAIIVRRARAWFSMVSRDVDSGPNANPDREKRRSDWLKQRIGTDASGPITVAGVELQLVDQSDGMLQVAMPSIIEGFPLAKVLPAFEAMAVALTITGGPDEGWRRLKWLCLLNEFDPNETALALRVLSEEVRCRTPESGVHPDLPARIAALLLWLSGLEQDEDAAAFLQPSLDRWNYEKDYLLQPSRSLYSLERRHADIVLNDTELPLEVRIRKTQELWFDPNFVAPTTFAKEVFAEVARIEVDKLNRHGMHTTEDHNFKDLEPVLARCASDLLTDLMRRKLQSIATCPPESRYWCAISVPYHLLLAGAAEAEAARTLRLSKPEVDGIHEDFAANRLLLVELPDLEIQVQFDTLLQAKLNSISTDFTEILHIPTAQDIDELLARYADGSPQQQDDFLILLSIHPIEFTDTTWSWLAELATQEDHKLKHVIFKILSQSDAARFGQMLVADAWSWHPDTHFWVNHYGTGALIEVTQDVPFDQLAPRLAPWRVLEAARVRGNDPAEVCLATGIFGRVLMAEQMDEIDPGAILRIERRETDTFPFSFSASAPPSPSAPGKLFLTDEDHDQRIKADNRAGEIADTRIRAAWKAGASLYIVHMAPEDFTAVLQQAPDKVAQWLEGCHDLSADFQRRVRLAEGAFLALCEALLAHDPKPGVALWHALRATLTTQYIGAAEVEELLHIVFRVPDSAEVDALREEVAGLAHCHSDEALFNLAIAATYNGKADWLANLIATDRASARVWQRKRGTVLAGFTAYNTLPVPGAWPEGEIKTTYAELKHKSARFQWLEACARHWWRVYLEAQDPAEAYAAWVLFLRSADRRAWIWIHKDIQATDDTSPFFKRKIAHFKLNRSELKRAMKKPTEKLDKQLFDRQIVEGIGPWA